MSLLNPFDEIPCMECETDLRRESMGIQITATKRSGFGASQNTFSHVALVHLFSFYIEVLNLLMFWLVSSVAHHVFADPGGDLMFTEFLCVFSCQFWSQVLFVDHRLLSCGVDGKACGLCVSKTWPDMTARQPTSQVPSVLNLEEVIWSNPRFISHRNRKWKGTWFFCPIAQRQLPLRNVRFFGLTKTMVFMLHCHG